MTQYSNSRFDIAPSKESRIQDEDKVRKMYEYSPYPDLGDDLKDLSLYISRIENEIPPNKVIRFLDVGCGTGHIAVGIAKKFPHWECYGIDLSSASLSIARKLAEKHNAKVEFHQGSYLDPLPFDGQFDIISAMGTIHHSADPLSALNALKNVLNDDGNLLLHMYGLRCNSLKFDLKEMLSILEPDLTKQDKRFEYYDHLIKHRKGRWVKRLATTSLYDVYMTIKRKMHNYRRKKSGVSWSPAWDAEYKQINSPWIDHFCHPCERAYEIPEIKALIEDSGFSLKHMLTQGTEYPQLIPQEWRTRYNQLNDWEKWRLSELLVEERGASFAMILTH